MLKQKYFLADIFILSAEKTADKIVMAENRMLTVEINLIDMRKQNFFFVVNVTCGYCVVYHNVEKSERE